jgi:hydrogenase maturation protease
LDGRKKSVVIFDAVECNLGPGRVFCARLSDSKFGFFATHNIPLKLMPGVEDILADAWVVGIQPKDTGFGEDLTEPVRRSAEQVVELVGRILEGSQRGPA